MIVKRSTAGLSVCILLPVVILKVHGCKLHGPGMGGLDGLPTPPSTWVTMTKDIVEASHDDWQLSRSV